MEQIIINYVNENITDELRERFINAAIHFIIDEEFCSDSDIKKINLIKNKRKTQEFDQWLKLSATYGYIIYRAIAMELIDDEEQIEYCQLLLKLSRQVSNYITMEITEETLVEDVKSIIEKFGITKKCNEFVLEKLTVNHTAFL